MVDKKTTRNGFKTLFGTQGPLLSCLRKTKTKQWKKELHKSSILVFFPYIVFVFVFITGATAEGLQNTEIRQSAGKKD